MKDIQTFEIYPTGRFLFNNEVQNIKDEIANNKAITECLIEPDILKITFNASIVNRAAMQEKVFNILISTRSKKNNKTD